MTAEALLPYFIGAIGALIGLLISVLAWAATRITGELKSLGIEMKATNQTLTNIEKDLRGELARLDRRVSLVEAAQNGHD